ncbi:hypothetical protein [Mycolicibacterium sp. A43C]
MISVQLDCEDMECSASEYVDVYARDLWDSAVLSGYVPEGWRIVESDQDGIALSLCPKHADTAESDR